ncbi:MAG: hypothetical protein ABWJ42_00390 [Sulfolobales archaeon]
MKEIIALVSDIRSRVDEIDLSKLKRSDAQVISLLKEVLTLFQSVIERADCLLSSKKIERVGSICTNRWIASLPSEYHIISISKLGSGIGFSIDLGERRVKIFNKDYSMEFTRDRAYVTMPTKQIEINLREPEEISSHYAAVSKTFRYVISTLRRSEDDFGKCIKFERIRC